MAQGDDNIHKILKRIRANLKEKINLLNNKISKKENKPEFFQGTFSSKDYLSPSYINISNPKFIEIDNTYYSTLIITNYFREQTDLILKSIIDTNINLNISISLFVIIFNPLKNKFFFILILCIK
jgi:hypothetical protein